MLEGFVAGIITKEEGRKLIMQTPIENFRKVAELLYSAHPDAMITLTGGEPTIHPSFKEIVGFSSHLFKQVCVTTNGSFDRDTAIAPLPVHKSKILGLLNFCAIFIVSSTKISVSG